VEGTVGMSCAERENVHMVRTDEKHYEIRLGHNRLGDISPRGRVSANNS
jgi:hypothetical protein